MAEKSRGSLRARFLDLLGKSTVPGPDKGLENTLRQYDRELRTAHRKASKSGNTEMVRALDALRDGIEQDYEKAYPREGSAWDEEDVAAQRTVFAAMVSNSAEPHGFTDLVDLVTPWLTRVEERPYGNNVEHVDVLTERVERRDSVYGTMIAALQRAAENGQNTITIQASAPKEFVAKKLSLKEYVDWAIAQSDNALAPEANPEGGTLEGAQRNREEVTPRPLPRARIARLGLRR